MLKRTIWNSLVDWKRREHHPLVIKGLRQTGKTYIVRRFAEEFYDNYVLLMAISMLIKWFYQFLLLLEMQDLFPERH